MSTLSVTTVQTANGITDLTLRTGNTSAGSIVIPASGAGITISSIASVSVAGLQLIDSNGGVFRTGGGNYGVRIYPGGGSSATLGALQFTNAAQNSQWGSLYFENGYAGVGTDPAWPFYIRTGGTNRVTVDGSSGAVSLTGNLLFNSGYGSAALAYAIRVWVSFNGTNGALFGSQGVTSVTRNAAGVYTVNFNFTMPDANYAVAGSGMETNGLSSGTSFQSALCLGSPANTTTTTCQLQNANVDGSTNVDGARITFMAAR